jgi:hypothetical protein
LFPIVDSAIQLLVEMELGTQMRGLGKGWALFVIVGLDMDESLYGTLNDMSNNVLF